VSSLPLGLVASPGFADPPSPGTSSCLSLHHRDAPRVSEHQHRKIPSRTKSVKRGAGEEIPAHPLHPWSHLAPLPPPNPCTKHLPPQHPVGLCPSSTHQTAKTGAVAPSPVPRCLPPSVFLSPPSTAVPSPFLPIDLRQDKTHHSSDSTHGHSRGFRTARSSTHRKPLSFSLTLFCQPTPFPPRRPHPRPGVLPSQQRGLGYPHKADPHLEFL